MRSLLITNDFPPKIGGIQSYLWELWRRLPPDEVGVFTTAHAGAAEWDAAQSFEIIRSREKVLLPRPGVARRLQRLIRERSVELAFVDPAVPIGLVGPRLGVPYVVVVHGAEVTVTAHAPGGRRAIRRVLRRAVGILAAGSYPATEAIKAARGPLDGLVIPPGVDTKRFVPLGTADRDAARRRFGLDTHRPVVLGLSRLVPRKGFDVLVDAFAGIGTPGGGPSPQLVIAGSGRDRGRLEKRAGADVSFLGRVDDADLPALYGCADLFAMLCRDRWRGLEREGFGIVFLEAAACAVPSIAGRSGGSHEAVLDGETGFVVSPTDVTVVRDNLSKLLGDDALRSSMADNARRRAVEEFDHARLAAVLTPLALGDLTVLKPL